MVPTMNDIEEYMDAVKQGLGSAPVGADPADCADCADARALGLDACARCRGEEWAPEREPTPPLVAHECPSCGEIREQALRADGLCSECELSAAGSLSSDSARAEARAAALDLARRAPVPPPDVQRDIEEVRWTGEDPWRPAALALAEYERGEDAAGCGARARELRVALVDLHASLDGSAATEEHLAQRVLLRSAIGEALAGRSVRELWSAVVTLRDY